MAAAKESDPALKRLTDIESIRQLEARYCHLVDKGRWDELEDLWTEDAVAGASWYFTAHATVNGRALWAMGEYRDRHARAQGEWKISAIAVEFKYYTPFEDGWVKTPMWSPA